MTAPFSKTKTNESRHALLKFNVCSSKWMDVFNSNDLRLTFYRSAECSGFFFSSCQTSTSCTRDPRRYILILNIQLAISQHLFWWGLLNYCFVWIHSKVNWSLLITIYISLSNGLQKNTLKWRLESRDLGTQRCLPDNCNSSLNWLTSQQQKRNKVFVYLFWDELQEPAEK